MIEKPCFHIAELVTCLAFDTKLQLVMGLHFRWPEVLVKSNAF